MGCRRLGESRLNRGEIRWYTFRQPDKRRPVLILSRNEVTDHLNDIIVVPVTRTIRGLTTEMLLSSDDGMPVVCVLNFDHVSLAALGLKAWWAPIIPAVLIVGFFRWLARAGPVDKLPGE